jgi:hypothetical protein
MAGLFVVDGAEVALVSLPVLKGVEDLVVGLVVCVAAGSDDGDDAVVGADVAADDAVVVAVG